MWSRIKKLLLPPVFENDEEKTQNAKLIFGFLLIMLSAAVLYPLLSFALGNFLESTTALLVWIFVGTTFTSLVVLRFGYVLPSGLFVCFVMWAVFTFGAYGFGGIHDTAITGFFILIIFAGMIGGWRVLVLFSGLSIISLLTLYFLELNGRLVPSIDIPAQASEAVFPVVIVIGITLLLRVFINSLTSALTDARQGEAKLSDINTELEASQVAMTQQTQELERRTRYLEATAIIARDVAAELDPATLLRRVTTLVSDQFGFYHTGIFLIDVTGEFAVLEAASSEGGRTMLENGHRLRVGQEGIVGFVSSQGKSRVALDTGADAVYFDNPYLPETRSEAALPLRVRGQVIGVLDVQSIEPNAFSENDIAVLQTMADQIAIALQNAQLFQQVEQSLDAQRRSYGEMSREAWERLTQDKGSLGYQYIYGQVIDTGETKNVEKTTLPEISVPIVLGNQVIGHIKAHKGAETEVWSNDEVSVMETLSSQLSVALESARLYQDTQKRAAREQLTTELTTRIRETLDIETMLKTASDEIRKALNLPEVVIRLGEPTSEPPSGAIE